MSISQHFRLVHGNTPKHNCQCPSAPCGNGYVLADMRCADHGERTLESHPEHSCTAVPWCECCGKECDCGCVQDCPKHANGDPK